MKNNEKGFSVVVILVILVIVGLIGTIGRFVWDKQNSKTSNNTQQNSTQKPEKTVASEESKSTYNDNLVVIDEWDVQISSDKVPTGFTYKIDGKVGSFRSKALNDVSSEGCESNSINVARGKADEIPPNSTNSTDTNFLEYYEYLVKEDTSSEVSTTRDIHLKIGEYYYVPPGYSGASCADIGKQGQESAAEMDIVKTINLMVASN